MKDYKVSIVPRIESMINQFTPLEKKIAQYFIADHDPSTDLSSKAVSKRLFVSEASLTRFAKNVIFLDIESLFFNIKNLLLKRSLSHLI